MGENFSNFKLSRKAQAKLKNKKLLEEELAKGKTAQEIMEISDATMAEFYKAASHLFENRHYADAANGFLFLVSMNAYNHDYWLGLGMATQMCGDFEAAINAYEMSAIYEVDNPIPYFYLAKCLFAMHERQSALLALDIAIQYAGDNPEYQELKKQALEAQALLKKHIF